MHLAAIIIFALGSVVCATAPSMCLLIAGRAIQGSAGGALIQLVSITISDLFSLHQRTLVLGMLESMWALAGGVGPILGGVFTEKLTWRWNFWVNLPVCGLAFALLAVFLDVHNPRTKAREGLTAIDWLGSVTILGFVLTLLIGLDLGGTIFPWNSPTVIVLIVMGCFMAALFVLTELRLTRHPLIPMHVFALPSNVATLVICSAHGFVGHYTCISGFGLAAFADILRSTLLGSIIYPYTSSPSKQPRR